MSKAARIRNLYDAGMLVADIARVLNIRYQHAYNVIKEYKRAKGVVMS